MIRKTQERLLKEQNLIIKYIFKGLSNAEIARKMHYSRSTISYRINAIFDKYNAATRHELILAILAILSEKNKQIIKTQKKKIDELNSDITNRDILLKNIIYDFEKGYKLHHRIEEAKALLS